MFSDTNCANNAMNGIINAWKGTIIDATRIRKVVFENFDLERAK